MNLKNSMYLFIISLTIIGCSPPIPGIDIPPTPVAWSTSPVPTGDINSIKLITKNFDLQGNAYILYSYLKNIYNNSQFELVKVDPNGMTVWRTTGLANMALTQANIRPSMQYAKLLFDSVGSIYIVTSIVDLSASDSGVFTAKISNSGSIAWQNAHIGYTTRWTDLTSAVISNTDTLYVATLNDKRSNIFAYDELGSTREIYAVNYPPISKIIKMDIHDNIYVYQRHYSNQLDSPSPYLNQFVKLSATGQIMQTMDNMIMGKQVKDFLIAPDGSIYITHFATVEKYDSTGNLLWNTTNSSSDSSGCSIIGNRPSTAMLSANGELNVMYLTNCPEKLNYIFLKLNASGEEIARIEPRNTSTLSNAYVQMDESNNILIMEVRNFASIEMLLPVSFDVYLTFQLYNRWGTLTKIFDPTGNFVTEAYTPGISELPIHQSKTGSLSIFNKSLHEDFRIVNHSAMF